MFRNRRAVRWLAGLFVLLLLTTGCNREPRSSISDSAQNKVEVIDSIGRKVEIAYPVTRAALSNAYNAELVTAIGAIDRIVGVDYHIFQDQEGFQHRFTENMVIGQSQNELNYEKIIELQPQVVILTSNGSWKEAEEKLRPFGIAVLCVDSYYTEQFEKNVLLLGKIFGEDQKASELSDYFTSRLKYIEEQLKEVPKRTVYFEYRSPGRTTFPGDYFFEMVRLSQGENIFQDAKGRTVDLEAVVERNPQYIVKVSDENIYSSYVPPKREEMEQTMGKILNRTGWDQVDAVRNHRILLLSHYAHGGASKLVGTMYIAKYLYPEYLPDLDPEEVFRTWVTRFQRLEYPNGHVLSLQELTQR